jgi:hypothetical protein
MSNSVTITGAGTVTLAANQPGDATFLPAPQITTTFEVEKGSQRIFGCSGLADKTFGDPPFSIPSAMSSSGLPVTISVTGGPGWATNNTVYILGAGIIEVKATQAGNSNYEAARPVRALILVKKASQTIAPFATIPDRSPTDPSGFSVSIPNSNSGLPVKLSVKSGPAVLKGENFLVIKGKGRVVLAANQPGDENYIKAPEATTNFQVR